MTRGWAIIRRRPQEFLSEDGEWTDDARYARAFSSWYRACEAAWAHRGARIVRCWT